MIRREPDRDDPAKAPLRMLFFEDQLADVELSLWALRSAGYEINVDVAVTVPEVIERVRSTSYDVILSDYRMPGATGMELFEALQKEGLSLPFILVTGSLGDENAVECVKSGVADYVLKDHLARLPIAVRRVLEEKRLREQRARAEEALRHSEASYRSMIEGAPYGIFRSTARGGRFLEVNPALIEMLGYRTAAEVLGLGPADVYLNPKAHEELMRQCDPFGQLKDVEVQWKQRDATPITIRLSGRLVRDEQGSECFEMIAENISERKRAEERIRQLHRLYTVLTRVSQAIVRIRERDELLRQICRIAVEEGGFRMAWVGMRDLKASRIDPVVHWGMERDDLAGIASVVQEPFGPADCAIRDGRHVVCDDTQADAPLPHWRALALHCGYRSVGAFPLAIQGTAIGAILFYASERGLFDPESLALLDELAADVSFALESMELARLRQGAVDKLNHFFNLSLEMLCIAGVDGRIQRLNPAWEKTLGLTAGELQSRALPDLLHPEDRQEAEAAIEKLQAGAEVNWIELRFLAKDGAYKWLVINAAPLPQQGLIFVAARDLSDRKRLEEQLRSQNVALEEQNRLITTASRMKSEFLANMSHELRSPLNGIIGFSELLYDGRLGPLAERQRDFLGRILNSARHLLQLINGVLDLSKVEAGRVDLRPERISLSGVVQEVTGTLGTLAAEKQIRVLTSVDPELEHVVADPGRLKQVLYNYLSNALKFTGEGGEVRVNVKQESATAFRLEVSDTGVGIAEKDLARLFVEFQQLDSSTAKRYQGTGLGLALTKRVVEAQGGRVGVESVPGKGSTFFAILPRGAPAVAEPPPRGAPRVLIIEDDESDRNLFTCMLLRAGYAVETASTCAQALEKFRERAYDAITLDLFLPDASGRDMLEAIRSAGANRDTSVIVISVAEKADMATLPGVQAFLRKPIHEADLLAALELAGVGKVMEKA